MPDVLLFKSTYDDSTHWGRVLRTQVPGLEVRVWPEVGRVEDVAYALVWKPEHGDLKRYPNLKVILSLGAGVDHVFEDPELPRGVPVARIVDLDLAAQMSEYVLYGVLHFHRKMPAYIENQRRREWGKPGRAVARQCRVGVMGMGVIGGDAAHKLAALDFDVRGWSRTEKRIEGIKCFHGPDQLASFLGETDILVCVLPLTRATNGIINAKMLSLLPRGDERLDVVSLHPKRGVQRGVRAGGEPLEHRRDGRGPLEDAGDTPAHHVAKRRDVRQVFLQARDQLEALVVERDQLAAPLVPLPDAIPRRRSGRLRLPRPPPGPHTGFP